MSNLFSFRVHLAWSYPFSHVPILFLMLLSLFIMFFISLVPIPFLMFLSLSFLSLFSYFSSLSFLSLFSIMVGGQGKGGEGNRGEGKASLRFRYPSIDCPCPPTRSCPVWFFVSLDPLHTHTINISSSLNAYVHVYVLFSRDSSLYRGKWGRLRGTGVPPTHIFTKK